MVRPKNKSEELRLASKILWLIGVGLTSNFVLTAISNPTIIHYIVVPLVCFFIQYAVTKVTSAIFSGAIPPPWSKKATTPTIWIWSSSVLVLIMDWFINLGGVGTVARLITGSSSGDVLKAEFGASEGSLKAITGLFIIALALLVAIGPELCTLFADLLEPTKPFGESKSTQFERKPKEVEVPKIETIKQEVKENLPDDILAQLKSASLAASSNRNNKVEIPLPNRRIKP